MWSRWILKENERANLNILIQVTLCQTDKHKTVDSNNFIHERNPYINIWTQTNTDIFYAITNASITFFQHKLFKNQTGTWFSSADD